MSVPKRRRTDGEQSAKLRRLVVVVLLCGAVIASAVLGSGVLLASRVGSNCDGIHNFAVVGADIIDDGFEDLRQYRDDGLLSQEQYERAVKKTRGRLAKWRAADCK